MLIKNVKNEYIGTGALRDNPCAADVPASIIHSLLKLEFLAQFEISILTCSNDDKYDYFL